MNMENKILVLDLNRLPEGFIKDTLDATRKYYESEYGLKVLIVDSSRQNIQGNVNNPPAYFI